jgi:hypothetical protein
VSLLTINLFLSGLIWNTKQYFEGEILQGIVTYSVNDFQRY